MLFKRARRHPDEACGRGRTKSCGLPGSIAFDAGCAVRDRPNPVDFDRFCGRDGGPAGIGDVARLAPRSAYVFARFFCRSPSNWSRYRRNEDGSTRTDPPCDFFYSRSATQLAEALLTGDKAAIVLIEGPPLVGKSSVLRELAMRTEESPDLAMPMLRG